MTDKYENGLIASLLFFVVGAGVAIYWLTRAATLAQS